MERDDCPSCLGTKTVFNGVDFKSCNLCKGTGKYYIDDSDDYDSYDDHLLLDNDDFEQYDDEKYYNDDNEF
jgi:hypothetical protein